jgi:hypothetical protein
MNKVGNAPRPITGQNIRLGDILEWRKEPVTGVENIIFRTKKAFLVPKNGRKRTPGLPPTPQFLRLTEELFVPYASTLKA